MSSLSSEERRNYALRRELTFNAHRLCRPGQGILASDESPSTLGKRLEKHGIENTPEKRRQYRELFYTAPELGVGISGAILFPEALHQTASDGISFVEHLRDKRNILVGVKVDLGLHPINDSGETETKGLEGLEERCKQYKAQGASFAKWRAALRVPPSPTALDINAAQLADYAVVCQRVGLVPIVEPELLIDGTHSAEEAEHATAWVLSTCISHLLHKGVWLEGILLKPQMVLPGVDSPEWGTLPRADVVERTLRALRSSVPPAVPGIMFLSGGQSEVEATQNLYCMNSAKLDSPPERYPWALSFSFGRALQSSVLLLWTNKNTSDDACKEMAAALGEANGLATKGVLVERHPSVMSADVPLQESFRGWRPPTDDLGGK